MVNDITICSHPEDPWAKHAIKVLDRRTTIIAPTSSLTWIPTDVMAIKETEITITPTLTDSNLIHQSYITNDGTFLKNQHTFAMDQTQNAKKTDSNENRKQMTSVVSQIP